MEPSTHPLAGGTNRNRKRALLAVLPLLALGLFSLALLLLWGLEPLWAFAILPPILFVSALGWLFFSAEEGAQDDSGD